MSGSRYEIFMAPSAHRRFKKFNPALQKKVKEEAEKLAVEPRACEGLKGPLKASNRGISTFVRRNTELRFACLKIRNRLKSYW